MPFKSRNILKRIKDLDKLTGIQTSSIIAAIILGVFSAVIFYTQNSIPTAAFYYTIIITITLGSIIDRVTKYIFENNTSNALEKFMNDGADLKYLGDVATGSEWFCQNLHGLVQVKNTTLRYADEFGENRTHFNEFTKAARSIIGPAKATWKDLHLHGENTDENFKFCESLSPEQIRSYKHAKLTSDLPIMQIMILKYDNVMRKAPVVLFGWAYLGSPKEKVFRSSDRDVVEYFETYFDALYKAAEELPNKRPDRTTLSPPAPAATP